MEQNREIIRTILVDDHKLFRKGIAELVNNFEGFKVIYEAGNGRELVDRLPSLPEKPDIILLDINMKEMNGYETMSWLHDNHPNIKVIVLSM